jgi:hypothetical protein
MVGWKDLVVQVTYDAIEDIAIMASETIEQQNLSLIMADELAGVAGADLPHSPLALPPRGHPMRRV